MRRDLALLALKRRVSDRDLVVAVYQACFDWMALAPRDLNYLSTGAMGQASSHGLGLALANPDRRVLVLDGDGSLLMNLGSLVSVAEAGCENFHHLVFCNGVYEVNGGHPVPGAGRVDFAAMARAAGYRHTARFADLGEFEAALDDFLATPGPALASLDIEPGEAYPRDYPFIHSPETRARFRRALTATAAPRQA